MKPTIRPTRADDWSRLCAIHDAARLDELRRTVGVDAFLDLETTWRAEGLFDDRVDVACVGDEVVGFVAHVERELTWLYVDPAHARHGVGRALVRHVISERPGPLRVEVLEGNTPALALYASEGFAVVDRVEGRLEGNEEHAAVGLVLERA